MRRFGKRGSDRRDATVGNEGLLGRVTRTDTDLHGFVGWVLEAEVLGALLRNERYLGDTREDVDVAEKRLARIQ